jgi:D-alanyl-D-alanine carboxypeptidase
LVYSVASISKWLTTTTVLKLVETGKLSLDAPITT